MSESKLLPLLTWRSAISTGDSGLDPTTRHVGLALSLYANEKGASARPGAPLLAQDTGYSVRCVREHLAKLEAAGWLELVEKGGLAGERKRANEYQLRIPDPPLPLDGESSVTGDPALPVTLDASMGDPDDTDGVRTITPSLQELSKNSPVKARERAVRPPRDFVPTAEHEGFAEQHGLAVVNELAGWLDWCEAHAKTYKVLNAGFSTWLRQAVNFGRGHPSRVAPAAVREPRSGPSFVRELDQFRPSLDAWVCALGNAHCHNGIIDDPDAPTGTPVARCECMTQKATA